MKQPTGWGWLSLIAAIVCTFGCVFSMITGQTFYIFFNAIFAVWNWICFKKNINREA